MTPREGALYGLAAALGAGLAVFAALDRPPATGSDPVEATAGSRSPDRARAPSLPHAQLMPPQLMPRSEASEHVYGASGVTLEPFRVGELFIGYGVLRSHDARLAVGDVVTAVDGEPVEEGAAGAELLIAALRRPEVTLTLQSREYWITPRLLNRPPVGATAPSRLE